jgi:hypothetical protein
MWAGACNHGIENALADIYVEENTYYTLFEKEATKMNNHVLFQR